MSERADAGRSRSGDVSLEIATTASRSLLSNLLELYVYDLSEIFSIKVGADGRFGYDKLPLYWSETDTHFAYLIRSNADVAGFALITRGSPATDDPNDLDVAEFFVLRSYRGCGVGRRAAFLLWDRHPGRWVVRVSELNRGGLPFWERAIREYTRGAFCEKTHPGKSHLFRVFSFTSAIEKPAV
jgi:predicted acetyltransferase